jgi:PKD repeat protein
MKRLLAFVAGFFLLTPSLVLAVTDGPDIGIKASDIYFSEKVLVSGETIRLYATLQNKGNTDISGYIVFFQGDISVGSSQVVTLVSDGLDEQVWVDFTVPQNPFNIRAEIRGTDPQDVNPDNDLALTPLFTPIQDDDGDGVANEDDNCPDNKNANQKDYDGDGLGDVCDPDDDNDGLSDEIEAELGTDATSKDSDGDGVNDTDDAFPLDSSRSKIEVPVATTSAESASETTTTSAANSESTTTESPASTDTETSSDVPEATESEEEPESEADEMTVADAKANFKTSPQAAFEYSPIDWKTYEFRVLATADGAASVSWDFGDGVTSAQHEVTHTYQRSGDYKITLTVVDADGQAITDAQEIEISFFHLANPVIKLAIGFLALLLLSSLILVFKRGREKLAAVKRLNLGADGGVKEEPDGVEPAESVDAEDDSESEPEEESDVDDAEESEGSDEESTEDDSEDDEETSEEPDDDESQSEPEPEVPKTSKKKIAKKKRA